jgi:hypothetical protein
MCNAYDADTDESGWRPCPPSLCERPDHAHNLIGKRATIVGYSEDGAPLSRDFVAHICLDIEDGPRVFFQASDPAHFWRIVVEPR